MDRISFFLGGAAGGFKRVDLLAEADIFIRYGGQSVGQLRDFIFIFLFLHHPDRLLFLKSLFQGFAAFLVFFQPTVCGFKGGDPVRLFVQTLFQGRGFRGLVRLRVFDIRRRLAALVFRPVNHRFQQYPQPVKARAGLAFCPADGAALFPGLGLVRGQQGGDKLFLLKVRIFTGFLKAGSSQTGPGPNRLGNSKPF